MARALCSPAPARSPVDLGSGLAPQASCVRAGDSRTTSRKGTSNAHCGIAMSAPQSVTLCGLFSFSLTTWRHAENRPSAAGSHSNAACRWRGAPSQSALKSVSRSFWNIFTSTSLRRCGTLLTACWLPLATHSRPATDWRRSLSWRPQEVPVVGSRKGRPNHSEEFKRRLAAGCV